MARRDPDRLTDKQKLYLKYYSESFDKMDAYKRACRSRKDLSRKSLTEMASHYHANAVKKAELAEKLDLYGLSDDVIFSKFKDLLEAQKPTVRDGKIVEWYPDSYTQLNAAKAVANWKGFEQKQFSVNIDKSRRNNLVVIAMDPKEAKRQVDDIDYQIIEEKFLGEEEKDEDG